LDNSGPLHVHNQPGVASVRIGVKEFMCIGALPPFDHPHIFIDMGEASEARCSYCSTLFLFDAQLGRNCDPRACAYTPELESIYEAAAPEGETTHHSLARDTATKAAEPATLAGVIGSFQTEAELTGALQRLRALGVGDLRTFAPQERQRARMSSPLPWLTLIGGLIGVACGFAMQHYVTAAIPPIAIGGNSRFSWPSLAPIAFLAGVVLCAIGGAAIAAGRFTLHDREDGGRTKSGAMRDCWSVLARTDDPQRRAQSRALLESLDARNIEEIAS
jgi:uncharacterized Zn-finger protein